MTILIDIKPIQEGTVVFNDKDEIKKYVEMPLLKTCEMLFDLNIQTQTSSCNKHDSRASFALNFETLNAVNKKIAEKLAKKDPEVCVINEHDWYVKNKTFSVTIKVADFDSIEGLSAAFEKIAGQFKKQERTW